MIRIQDLHKRLAGEVVLRGVELDTCRGEILALVGPSGTGKSVLLKHVVGLLLPDRGDVLVDGRSVCRADYRELARLRARMGYVFQDAALLDSLSIRENLLLALGDEVRRRDPGLASYRVAQALETVRLPASVLQKLPGELSGGMRKRVGVARALVNAPELLLYDEPATGLDPRNVQAINQVVLEARERFTATSIVVTHDLASVDIIADRVALLVSGRIQFLGTPREFFTSDDAFVRDFTGRGDPAAGNFTGRGEPAVGNFIGRGEPAAREDLPWPAMHGGATR
jgi:phospholipid/cholesterol/gamma-HCH transport system ATP-binding protein